jgi:S-formylglutathione hydrolase FrmB
LNDAEATEAGTISRRQAITGAGLLAAAGAAGAGTSVGPRIARRLRRDHVGVDVAVPSEHVPVATHSFESTARHRRVHLSVAVPEQLDRQRPVPVCVWLHAKGASASSVMNSLRVPNFLAEAVRTGVAPFVIAAVDGGNRYWHRRRDGDDPEAMVIGELPAQLAKAGITAGPWAIAGWSMGGYGALLLAERHDRFVAVAASSAAVWFHGRDTRPGAFDSAEDFARHDVLADLASLPPAVRIDCGLDDPFASTSSAMLRRIPGAQGGMAEGAHTMRFWRSVLPAQLAFLGRALSHAAS